MSKTNLDFQTTMKSENYEEMEVSCAENGVSLTIPRFEKTPPQTIHLSFDEFDEVAGYVAKYRKMQEIIA